MAFADYFHRAIDAASQALRGFDASAFKSTLNKQRVAIAIDRSAANRHEGRALADLAIRLLARMYPRILIVALDKESEALRDELSQLAKAINPKILLNTDLEAATACLAICSNRIELPRRGSQIFYLGSDGWIARLSTEQPRGIGRSRNPLGAGAAACFGAANLFRSIFHRQLPGGGIDRNIELSLLDLNPASLKAINVPLKTTSLGNAHLVGLGAIGNGTIWALANSPVTGTFHVIDAEQLELSNLQRYVMSVRRDVNQGKVELARAWLASNKKLKVLPHAMTWDCYAPSTDWRFESVAVALDNAPDRIGVQASLPRWIVNGWTQEGEAGISRHDFSGNTACLACLYIPDHPVPNEDELVAAELGFTVDPTDVEFRDIRRRLQLDSATEREFLRRIAALKGIALDVLLPFEGKPLRTLYTEGICGGKVIEFSAGGQQTLAEVPMPFQSTLSGVLLASELVARCAGLRGGHEQHTISRIDLLRPLPRQISFPRMVKSGTRCICQDDDFRDVFNAKYSPSEA